MIRPYHGTHTASEPTVVVKNGCRTLVWALHPGAMARQARSVLRECLGNAGVGGDLRGNAEIAVAELAANAEMHGHGPYELRIVVSGGTPVWCEVVDALPGLRTVRDRLVRLGEAPRRPAETVPDELLDGLADALGEHGRGLLLVHRLSGGRCTAYVTRHTTTGRLTKAVGFALPRSAEAPPSPSWSGPSLPLASS